MVLQEIQDVVTSGVVGLDFVSDILLIADMEPILLRWSSRSPSPPLFAFACIFLVLYPLIIGIYVAYKKTKDFSNDKHSKPHNCPQFDSIENCCHFIPIFFFYVIKGAAANFIAPLVGIITPIWKLMGHDVLSQDQKMLLAYWKFGEALFESLPQLVINCIYITRFLPDGATTTSIVSMLFSLLQLLIFVLNFPRNMKKLRGDDKIFSVNV